MIEDFTDYDEVKEGDCITTGIIDYENITAERIDSSVLDGSKIACKNHINICITDSNGRSWRIEEMKNGTPYLVQEEE